MHLVGEICFCLKVLGATDDDPLVSKCKTFILDRQVGRVTHPSAAAPALSPSACLRV